VILHALSAMDHEGSGPSYSVPRLCESMIAAGVPTKLAVLDWVPGIEAPPYVERFPLSRGPRRLGRSPAMARWLIEQVKAGAVEIIHNHGLWMMPNVYPGQVARKYSVPLVVSPRGTLSEWAFDSGSRLKQVIWPLLQKPSLAATTCFHATALSEYEDIRRRGFRQPVAVIPNGIDIPDLLPKAAKDHRDLLFLGRVHPKKGLDMLLPAWRAVQHRFPDWQLKIAGPDNGGYLAKMQRLAAELSLERVEFSGALLGEQKWHAYRQADLFVLPTYSENFGMTVAEALAAGTPAIVSKGAPWSGLPQRQAGWWIDIGLDPLVASLEEALAQPAKTLLAYGQYGRKWMEEEYSWSHIGWRMADTYRWLLRGDAKPEWMLED
jgi:glycosyltransferase involved in cell wall biosynthesis